MEHIKTKTVLSKCKYGNEWYGIDYAMNLYRGCSHGCIYCDSRSNCYRIEDFDRVRGKEHVLGILEKELRRYYDHGVVGIGAMSDTYNPMEAVYEYTREALKLLLRYDYGVSIDTKSDLILRDLDLLKQMNERNNVIVKVTITCADDALSLIVEPNVCASSRRFEIIKELRKAGIYAGIMMNPILPYVNDDEENILAIVQKAHAADAKFIHTYMGMTLRENQRDYYYQKLNAYFPGLVERYEQRFENRYLCKSEYATELGKCFRKACKECGILYRMQDIIRDYKKDIVRMKQMSLF